MSLNRVKKQYFVMPPMALKAPTVRSLYGEGVVDPYTWMQKREDPKVRDLLEEENAYAVRNMAHTQQLQKLLYQEMVGRLPLDRVDVPVPHGPYHYYSRDESEKSYPIHCRRRREASALEEILLDENVLARKQGYFSLEIFSVSPDHRRCVYGVDTKGNERLSLFVRDFANDTVPADCISEDSASSMAWANDGETFFYMRLDAKNRPYQVVRHHLSNGCFEDMVVYEENDEAFRLHLGWTESGAFIVLTAVGLNSITEIHYLSADDPGNSFRKLCLREDNVEYNMTHHGADFYILTNEDAPDKKIMKAPVANPDKSNWRVFVPPRSDSSISYIQAFSGHLVLYERHDGLPQLRVQDMDSGVSHIVDMPEAVYALYPGDNREFQSSILRFGYDSLTTPFSIYDYNMETRERVLKQQWKVRGYDSTAYKSERIWVPVGDGVRVPLSLVYNKTLLPNGENPVLLYGYGAYGYSLEAGFSSIRLSLLDRGFIYAIAHVRGGGEFGRKWHEQGKGGLKQNSFTDFIACAEHLIREKYTNPERLAAMGESAGGLLVGAVVNQHSDLFQVVVADTPFVDVINTLTNASLPETSQEWGEWGNPLESKEEYDYIRAYSPYDNIRATAYPHMLILGSFNDSHVPYWEPLKWSAKLRDKKIDNHKVLVKIRLAGGHQGVSGRFAELEEWSFVYAFLIDRLTGNVCIAD